MNDHKITLEGNYPDINHIRTGLYTLDKAVANKDELGIPLRTTYEISGHEHIGKSTFSYFLAAITAQAVGANRIVICDLEGLDKNYVISCLDSANFEGTLKIVDPTIVEKNNVVYRSHEEMMQEATDELNNPDTACIIFDAIGSVASIQEKEGDFGEAFMGRRAKLIAQVARRLATYLIGKPDPSIAIMVNHQHAIMGGQGHVTPGGVVLKHLAATRIAVWNKETITVAKTGEILGYQINGAVEKLRYGGKGRKFSIVNLPGKGISKDATAMFDCFLLGLATRGASVKVGGLAVGRIGTLFQYAQEDRHEKFEPFYEAIEKFDTGKEQPNYGGNDQETTDIDDEELPDTD